MTDPLSYARKQFYNEVREYDATLESWLRAEYKNLPDAQEAFYGYQSARKKSSIWSKLKTIFDFPSFTMGSITNKSIEEYLSQSRDLHDLEQRERKIMSGNMRFA